jgi:hypothetical protein
MPSVQDVRKMKTSLRYRCTIGCSSFTHHPSSNRLVEIGDIDVRSKSNEGRLQLYQRCNAILDSFSRLHQLISLNTQQDKIAQLVEAMDKRHASSGYVQSDLIVTPGNI